MGLWRGYPTTPWILNAYSIWIGLVFIFQMNRTQAPSTLPVTWFVIAWLFIMLFAVVFSFPFLEPAQNAVPTTFIVCLFSVLIVGFAFSLSLQGRWLSAPGQLVPLAIAFVFASLFVCASNYTTWRVWYDASEASRSWAPFRQVDEEGKRTAERTPYAAFDQYVQVLNLLGQKGRIPYRMGWQRGIQHQLATQIERTADAKLLNTAIHVYHSGPERLALINQIDFYTLYQQFTNQPADNSTNERIFRDFEIDDESNTLYLLDRWGGVSKLANGNIQPVWRPELFVNDAVDLELLNGGFVVLTANRTLLFSEKVDWLEGELAAYTLGGDVVDIELVKSNNTALIVSSRGEIAFLGATPANFPAWSQLYFKEDVIVDMELDVDEKGYYLLDAFGAIHGNHIDGQNTLPFRSPPIAPGLTPYWAGQRMAIDLSVDSHSRGLNVYTRRGELFSIAIQPYRETYRPLNPNDHQGVAAASGANANLYALESNGRVIRLPSDVETHK